MLLVFIWCNGFWCVSRHRKTLNGINMLCIVKKIVWHWCDAVNKKTKHQLINQYFIFYLYESVRFMINWINNVHKLNQHFSMEIFPKQSNVAHLQIIIAVLNFFLFEIKNKNNMLSFCCFSIKLSIYLIVVKKSRCYCVSELPTTTHLPPSERTLKRLLLKCIRIAYPVRNHKNSSNFACYPNWQVKNFNDTEPDNK